MSPRLKISSWEMRKVGADSTMSQGGGVTGRREDEEEVADVVVICGDWCWYCGCCGCCGCGCRCGCGCSHDGDDNDPCGVVNCGPYLLMKSKLKSSILALSAEAVADVTDDDVVLLAVVAAVAVAAGGAVVVAVAIAGAVGAAAAGGAAAEGMVVGGFMLKCLRPGISKLRDA